MQHDLLVTAQKCSVPIGALNTLSTTSKRYITTTFAASASQSSDSTLHNVLNQSITQDPLDQKELILSQDDNGRTHPTEDTASTPAPIPSHTTRSSPRDIHNISTTRDLTTTFAASASQPSDSTPQNYLNQSIRDLLDRKELNSIQDDYGRTPPTEGTASTQLPIPAYTTRSSPLDTRNVSTTRDRTTTFAASASQPSDSTLHNVLDQPIAPDPLGRDERNSVQDNDGHTPPTEDITSHRADLFTRRNSIFLRIKVELLYYYMLVLSNY